MFPFSELQRNLLKPKAFQIKLGTDYWLKVYEITRSYLIQDDVSGLYDLLFKP
jgi:hypothetical protein